VRDFLDAGGDRNVQADPCQRRRVRRLPARRVVAGVRTGHGLQHGERARRDVRGPRPACARAALLQLVQQVVPAVPRHHVEQEQRPAHDARLAAGRRARQRDDEVCGGHQGWHRFGEAERGQQRAVPGRLAQVSLQAPVAPGDREHAHSGVRQRGRGTRDRRQAPAAVDQQGAAGVGGDLQLLPGLGLGRRVVEGAADRRRDDGDRRAGPEPADRGSGGRRGDQEQVGALVDPQPVRGDIGTVDDGARGRPGRGTGGAAPHSAARQRCVLQPGGRPGTGREHTDHDVGGLAVQFGPQRPDGPGRGGGVHRARQRAARPQVREVQAVV
jgi:hypothetical protein